MSTTETTGIKSMMKETRIFPPPPDFTASAHIKTMEEYDRLYKRSIDDPEGFWGEIAEEFHWFKKWDKVMEWKLPYSKWFLNAKTNICYNCLDRHIEKGRGDKVAIIWEGEPGEVKKITYRQLHQEVCKFANVLKSIGVKKGDRVTIYLPMIIELQVAILACARIGAPHSVIFGGFSAQAIADRVEDADSHFIITADGSYRRGKLIPLKANVDEACDKTNVVKHVVVFNRADEKVPMKDGRDLWWHEMMAKASDDCPAEELDAEHMLFMLYTSGTTGKPKGIVHTTGGYMVYAGLTAKYMFDLKDSDTFWCTADIGWITGHTYIVYGILLNGVTQVMYEGAPNHPDWDRFWDVAERHKVSIFYTAPTAIRAFMRQGDKHVTKHNLSSMRLLGTVGEPINPEAWMWYHRLIGGEKCPIVDTWWQTETGGVMLAPFPGITPTKPGSATKPFFGVDPAIMDKDGKVQPANTGGFLVLRKPWPGMMRGIYGDAERYQRQYWEEIKGVYFTGDSSRCDEDGYYWIMGRVDDVIKVSGHRLGTAEVESALVSHATVAEAAVVPIPHELKGQAIVAFVTLTVGNSPTAELKKELMQHVAHTMGALARPEQIRFTEALPKTRSGKIMRRLLGELAAGGDVKGDTTTLEDFSVIAKLRDDA